MVKHIILLGLLFAFWGCKKENDRVPFDANDQAPSPLSNIQVENLPGGAIISYALPHDKSLLYVKAEYTIREGVNREVKASYYKHSLKIEGFPDTEEREVSLYAVSRGEHASKPVQVKVKPLTPPVELVFRSLKMEATFGGVNVQFENEAESDVVLTVLAKDSVGDMVPTESYYTKRPSGDFSIRGFNTDKRQFGVYVRDRWSNYSDTLYAELTPWAERKLDKTKFRDIHLPNDTYEQHAGGKFSELWDDKWNDNSSIFHTKPGTGLPQWFTFDLGDTVVLSRFKFYHRLGQGQGASGGAYTGADPEIFEIWGSLDPNQDGSFDDTWVKLGEFHSIKPSGEPEGTVTDEDFQFAVVEGEDFDFPAGNPPVRYLRWKTIKNWGSLDYCYINELTFWGNDK